MIEGIIIDMVGGDFIVAEIKSMSWTYVLYSFKQSNNLLFCKFLQLNKGNKDNSSTYFHHFNQFMRQLTGNQSVCFMFQEINNN